MTMHKRRIELMKAIVDGSVVGSRSEISDIRSEFDEVLKVQRIPQLPRRRLLQVLHSTRAMDTTLSSFLDVHGINGHHSLGQYISALTQPHPTLSQLSNAERQHYKQNIVDIRNAYMHRAGGFPGRNQEIDNLLSEMHACLTRILNL